MKRKKILKRLCITAAILITVVVGLYITYKVYFDPYRQTVQTAATSEPLSMVLSKKQATDDLSFVLSKLKERHPAFMKDVPAEVQTQFNEEIKGFSDKVTVLQLWQASSRVLSKLKDGHTNMGYYGDDPSQLPLTFDLEDGELYCSGNSFDDIKVKAINGTPWQDIYRTYLKQFSYELENYAEYNFTRKLPLKLFLAFVGLDTSSDITITFIKDNQERVKSFEFEVPNEKESNDVKPFVSYEIDKGKSLGVLTLLSCDYNELYCKTLNNFFTEVKTNNIQNVAVDLRNNGGGNSKVANEFMRYLNVDDYYVAGNVEIRYGNFLQKFKKSIVKNKKYNDLLFTGKVYALTSDVTFSSAKMFANMIQDNHIGELIGEVPGNMPASYGDILFFQTPNAKLAFTVSYKYFGRIDEAKEKEPLIPDYQVTAENAMDKLYEIIEGNKTE